jgi:hypothetical protein
MKIGFFGDSFCSDIVDRPGCNSGYETYINKLKNHYNAEVVNLGISGCSIYDVILLQIKPFIDKNKYPDVCIFVWTNYGRLFHRKKRRGTAFTDFANSTATDPIVNAAKQYITYFLDWELQKFQYVSALHYFDSTVLSKFPKNVKIFHLWGFEKLHEWEHGVELSVGAYKSLWEFASDGRKVPKADDPELNHIDGDRKNNLLFETIKTEIDNYEYTTI